MLLLLFSQSSSNATPAQTAPYINWWSDTAEQTLLQELMSEAIGMHGVTVTYLPRDLRREDVLYNEDIRSQFTRTYQVTAYIKNVFGWEGQGNFLGKFGMQMKDTISLMISRQVWASTFANATPSITRPKEGDLIYVPQPIDALMEVKFVEHEKASGQFYPLGKLTYFDLQLESYTNNQENFATGNTVIDAFESNQAYAQLLVLQNSGFGSYAVGETVFQGTGVQTATASGIVGSWDAGTKVLKLTSIKGEFANGSPVIGATTGSVFMLADAPNKVELPNDQLNDNDYLKNESLDILDSSK